jgi:hypothetical protein
VLPAFAFLRPLFPVKAAPPFSSSAIVIGDDLVPGSAKEARVTPPRLGYARHRSRSYNAVIRVYVEAGNVIETDDSKAETQSKLHPVLLRLSPIIS